MVSVKDSVPENLKTLFDPTSLTKKGLCPVTKIQKQDKNPLESHSLYFEMHGTGPEKILFVMGMNTSCFSWSPQVEHFGKSSKYTVLVFDNRGVGNSDAPRGPYSSSQMAEDIIVLLDYVGWTAERSIHLVGVSLGGMISQELAYRIPTRFISLSLGVTTPGGWRPWTNLPGLDALSYIFKATFEPDLEKKIPYILAMGFPNKWLEEKAEDDSQGRTNREVQTELYKRRMAVTRKQTLGGALSQMVAPLTHYVSPQRLGFISRSIPKVFITTGDEDIMVATQLSDRLKDAMPEAEFYRFKGTGHGVHAQYVKQFNEMLERVWEEGKTRLENSK
ncbi:alpha/beta-hydrolase [Heliocybe sulcata]|uniref:Alpha/beta-hydrolase n=1 Tax=Heliocybe sulcata TaxID=5364 RepID=A0A5C3N657_9AGAM|nr:alpha/beta-hydrolase [Heliocybe sulcata]